MGKLDGIRVYDEFGVMYESEQLMLTEKQKRNILENSQESMRALLG